MSTNTNFCVYATRDSDAEGIIDEGAAICAFNSSDDAEGWLRYDGQLGDQPLVVVAGSYGDCWLKTSYDPTGEPPHPFTANDLIVQRPGTHPGLAGYYWTTPAVVVLVAVPATA